MGTQNYKADVSEAVKKFAESDPGQPPSVLKVNYQDALTWHTHAGNKLPIQAFVDQDVKAYMDTIPLQPSLLRCSIELLEVDDQTPTHFESKIQELRALLEARRYEVECEQKSDGWHFAVASPDRPRNAVIFTQRYWPIGMLGRFSDDLKVTIGSLYLVPTNVRRFCITRTGDFGRRPRQWGLGVLSVIAWWLPRNSTHA